jgi:hypothetical protein
VYGSSPIVPVNDPTLIFANAGMNQSKVRRLRAPTRNMRTVVVPWWLRVSMNQCKAVAKPANISLLCVPRRAITRSRALLRVLAAVRCGPPCSRDGVARHPADLHGHRPARLPARAARARGEQPEEHPRRRQGNRQLS